jgi:arylsulfatase A-like enzyme
LRALVTRLGLAGALAGCAYALFDFAVCASRLGPFLPTGPLRFCGFLVGLYGLAGTLAGVGLGLIALALDRGDVGAALRDADAPGGRVLAYLVVGALALTASAVCARVVVEQALLLFHHRPLIGALCGAAAIGTALGVGLIGLALAPLISRLLPLGPRVTPRFRGAPIVALPSLLFGAYLGAGLIAADVIFLAGRPRMTHPVRALNAALATPVAIALGFGVGWAVYRLSGRLLARLLGHGEQTRHRSGYLAVLLAALAALVLPPAIGAALTWSTTRQLDLRPFVGGGAILSGALLLAHPLRGRRALRPLLVITPLLLALLFGLGRVPRVRKATSLVGLAPHLVRAIQLVTDLDRDGYSSVLGGGDCNDLDRRVHPGAFDWPDDGIDQDCNGHQATLAPRPPRTYAPVPDAVPLRPNVLLITLDALRADHVSCYGYNRRTTPNLDALARQGVRFEHGWAHAPSTRYSVPAILTGRYPSTIAVNNDPRVHWPPQVLPENRMLAEIMKDLGYRTAATLSYHYFERGWGLDQGFDDYDYHLYPLHSVGGDPAATSGSSARQLADLDIAWLTAHKDERFFLWSHFYDTHFRFERHPDLPESDFGGDELALYDGEIRYSDHHLGRVLDALKALGLWENTIVLVTADHGDGFGEHGIPIARRHGYHLYRTETQVPVIVRVPGVAARVVDTPIGHIDLIPTLLNLLRRPPAEEPQLFGESLLAAMLGDESQRDTRAIYQEVWFEGPTSLKALVTRGWHLIRNLVPSDTIELYDLDKDGREEHDLSGLGDAMEAQLLARLGEITDALAIPAGFSAHMKDALSRSPRAPQRSFDDTLGDWLRVTGADIETAQVAPGQSATVTVHFEVRGPIPDGWILFTHAIGPLGRAMNLDHAPIEGLVPLQTLEQGQFLRDPIRISVPVGWPAGPLRIELGLYKKGARAPARGAHSAGDAVTVATLEVTPTR